MTLQRESTWKNFPRTLRMATRIVLPKKTKDEKVKALIDETQQAAI
jgi:hypothetical protein